MKITNNYLGTAQSARNSRPTSQNNDSHNQSNKALL